MAAMEDLDLLKAAIAVALADGRLRRSEKGVIQGLAARIGVGSASYEAMLEAAEHDDSIADNILIRSKEKARTAFELLVAQARIDGDISDQERDLLVRVAAALSITGQDFETLYLSGMKRADELREVRKGL